MSVLFINCSIARYLSQDENVAAVAKINDLELDIEESLEKKDNLIQQLAHVTRHIQSIR